MSEPKRSVTLTIIVQFDQEADIFNELYPVTDLMDKARECGYIKLAKLTGVPNSVILEGSED